MFIHRTLLNKINELNKSALALSPQQTGKSTLIEQLQPEVQINLADQNSFVPFLSDPDPAQEN